MKSIQKILFLLAILTVCCAPGFAATIIINNVDDLGQGLNDPTPAQKIGGNTGTTIGQQRLQVFEAAAQVWRNALSSNVTIIVQATMIDRGFTPCTATSAVLGAATSIQDIVDFPNAHWPHTAYKVALANKLAGQDLAPGSPTPTSPDPGFLAPPFGDDIVAFFNPNLGQPNCFAGPGWYYGFDLNKQPAGTTSFYNVVLHEIGHGLGFANVVDEDGDAASHVDPGESQVGFTDVYSAFSHDSSTGKQWNQMTNAERAASAVNTNNVVWNGPTVTAAAPTVLSNRVDLKITSGAASGTILDPFGVGDNTQPTASNFAGTVAQVNDGTAPVTDGCEPFTVPRGQIALVDRGTCSFAQKAANAQAARASGLLVVNNAGGDVVNGMVIGAAARIPAVMISTVDGAVLRANLPAAVGFVTDPNQLAGADTDDQLRLYTPNPVQPGSTMSHWDTSATPNLLMEPFINSDLPGTLDLTDEQMTDIGWDGSLHCPNNSDNTSSTLVLTKACGDTGVSNHSGPFTVYQEGSSPGKGGFTAGGCTLVDVFVTCSTYPPGGQYSQCVSHIADGLLQEGEITQQERDAIVGCVD